MKSVITNILYSVVFGYVLINFQAWLKTDYLTNTFFKNSLVTLLVALVAINSATLGIVLSRIRDMLDRANSEKKFFTNTKKQMTLSIYEQVALIIIVTILLMVRNSSFAFDFVFWIDVLTAACFVYALLILMDTAKSVFKILDF